MRNHSSFSQANSSRMCLPAHFANQQPQHQTLLTSKGTWQAEMMQQDQQWQQQEQHRKAARGQWRTQKQVQQLQR